MTTTSPHTPAALREAFSHFPQGVVLIGAEVGGAPQGLVASTFTVGVSLDPPLVSFAVQHTSETWPLLRTAPRLGVSLMGRRQIDTTRKLAAMDRDRRFDGVDFAVDDGGALTVCGTPVRLHTRIHGEVRAGDHDIVLLEVLGIDSVPDTPAMVFHRSSFKELVALRLSA